MCFVIIGKENRTFVEDPTPSCAGVPLSRAGCASSFRFFVFRSLWQENYYVSQIDKNALSNDRSQKVISFILTSPTDFLP